jgi:uncharacterized protein (DUF2267 family)
MNQSCEKSDMSGVHIFDTVVQDGNAWLKAVMERLNTEDAHIAYTALKATLHALRDRIPPESAVHLGAQLPTVIRGVYFENWRMAGLPTKERHLGQFLEHVATAIPAGMGLDADQSACAVFEVMTDRLDHGEIAKVIGMLPMELRDPWPLLAQIDAAER